jgi:UDP-GlcNAc:undecaprenyl-phosphate GlcNAc-1-phosphate transferase
MQSFLLTFIGIFGLSYGLTALVRLVSQRIGFVNNPDGKRWNQRVVALGGGVAIFLAITAVFFWRGNSVTLGIFPAFLAMFLLGFWDDVHGTSPSAKLIVQVMCAAFVVSRGYMAPLPWTIPAIAITVIWIVGMTNSLNLIDNIDGLASGCTAIAALAMAAVLMKTTPALPGEALLLVGVAASALGFLAHNYHPARIFMGDAGSLPLGFLLAVFSTRLELNRPEISPVFSAPPLFTYLSGAAPRHVSRDCF